MKLFYRFFNAVHILLYRLTNGTFGSKVQGLPILILTSTGRKTGKARSTPLGYFIHEGGYVITGSNSGRKSHPGWFYNLQANPHATIRIGSSQVAVQSVVADPDLRAKLWNRLLELSPAYGGYEKRAGREIPMVVLTPADG